MRQENKFFKTIKIFALIQPLKEHLLEEHINICQFIKRKRKYGLKNNLYRLSLRLKSWGVGTLLIRVGILGNELPENRKGCAS